MKKGMASVAELAQVFCDGAIVDWEREPLKSSLKKLVDMLTEAPEAEDSEAIEGGITTDLRTVANERF